MPISDTLCSMTVIDTVLLKCKFPANTDSERAPLIQNYVRGLPSMYTESVGNFYSPLASPDGSMYGFNSGPVLGRYPPVRLTREQVRLI